AGDGFQISCSFAGAWEGCVGPGGGAPGDSIGFSGCVRVALDAPADDASAPRSPSPPSSRGGTVGTQEMAAVPPAGTATGAHAWRQCSSGTGGTPSVSTSWNRSLVWSRSATFTTAVHMPPSVFT